MKLALDLPKGREHGNRDETEGVRLLLVKCGPYRLGVPAGLVKSVVGARDIVPLGLPNLPGLLWRDGALIPAVELAPLIGVIEKTSKAIRHGVLIRSSAGSLCFMVDEAMDLVEVPPDTILPLPPLVVKATGLSGLESATFVNGLLLIADPVLVLGQEKAADLVAAAANVGESGGS